MLLRRITKHVTDQNWFAVFIDFLIVVVGVYIGVQVSNWNADRQDRADYNEIYEQVILEMKQNIQRQDFVLQGVKKELPIVQRALDDLRACNTDENALKNVQDAIIPLSAPYTLLLETTALNQIINHKDYVQNQTLEQRKLINRLHEVSKYFRRQSDLQGESFSNVFNNMNQIIRPGPLNVEGPDEILKVILSDKPLSPPLHRTPTLVTSLEEACQNKDFLSGFYSWETSAFQYSITAGRLDKMLRSILEALGHPIEELPGGEL